MVIEVFPLRLFLKISISSSTVWCKTEYPRLGAGCVAGAAAGVGILL